MNFDPANPFAANPANLPSTGQTTLTFKLQGVAPIANATVRFEVLAPSAVRFVLPTGPVSSAHGVDGPVPGAALALSAAPGSASLTSGNPTMRCPVTLAPTGPAATRIRVTVTVSGHSIRDEIFVGPWAGQKLVGFTASSALPRHQRRAMTRQARVRPAVDNPAEQVNERSARSKHHRRRRTLIKRRPK